MCPDSPVIFCAYKPQSTKPESSKGRGTIINLPFQYSIQVPSTIPFRYDSKFKLWTCTQLLQSSVVPTNPSLPNQCQINAGALVESCYSSTVD